MVARSRKIRNKTGERGAALVEFALVLPLFLMITFGMLTAGIAFNHKIDLSHAAREGARYAATVPLTQCATIANCGNKTWPDLIQSVVAERSYGDVTATDAQVCVAVVTGANSVLSSYSTDGTTCYDDGGADTGNRVHVSITKTGDRIQAILFSLPVTLTTKATAKLES
jgi:Flp pilus assembly protein TadG